MKKPICRCTMTKDALAVALAEERRIRAEMDIPDVSLNVRPGEGGAFHEKRTMEQDITALPAHRRIRALLDISADACHGLGELAVQADDQAETLSARGDALFDAGLQMVEMGSFLMRVSGQCHGEAYERRQRESQA